MTFVFGFSKILPETITHMATHDVFSTRENEGKEDNQYLLSDTLINETVNYPIGYGYNEIGFEKKQNGKIIEPDYFVVCKQNGEIDTYIDSLKTMLSEFGNKTPIIIIDVDKCLQVEQKKVYDMISKFEKTGSIEQKTSIIQKIKNNLITAGTFGTSFLGLEVAEQWQIESKLEDEFNKRKDFRSRLSNIYYDNIREFADFDHDPMIEEAEHSGLDFMGELEQIKKTIQKEDDVSKNEQYKVSDVEKRQTSYIPKF